MCSLLWLLAVGPGIGRIDAKPLCTCGLLDILELIVLSCIMPGCLLNEPVEALARRVFSRSTKAFTDGHVNQAKTVTAATPAHVQAGKRNIF